MSTPAVNDVSISIATVNGSGSASANSIFYKAIFKMGIPCSAKNIFPSNIQGLPTWYQIRVNGQGYLGRKDVIDVVVIFNEVTAKQDVEKVREGGLVVYDSSSELSPQLVRQSLQYIGVPAWNLVKEHIKQTQLREKQRNMIYVGALAKLFGVPMDTIREVLKDTFGTKPAVIESNLLCIKLGYEYIESKSETQTICRLQPIPDGNKGKIMTEGNTAAAIGAIYGGCSVVAWYPITPSSSLVEEMIARIDKFRTDEKGRKRYAIVQAEDELASAAMVVGAGFCGARTMTATAGPGLSLMQEGIGLGYFAEVPGVFFIVQRGGPSTGLPTRTQQADITLMHQGSHGDTKHIVLIPHDNPSVFEMAWKAFDYADRFQTPVFVAMDLDIGMNLSNSGPFLMPDRPFDRGKLVDAEQVTRQGNKFRRYFDADGDGIPQRSIPGNPNPAAAYFARGSGHDEDGRYSESNAVYKATLDRLRRKYETARRYVPPPIVYNGVGSRAGLISFGSTFEPAREAVDRLEAEGYRLDHLLLRALPLNGDVEKFLASHDVVYLAEQNRDGQMTQIVRDDFPHYADRIRSILIYDGLPPTAGEIVSQIKAIKGAN
jgi:2-oxoglutarate ferredoxin oxidoreductase subunit alpha